MTEGIQLRYRAPGRVAAAFMASRCPVRMIMGPIGSGKTSAALMFNIYRAIDQAPSPLDGWRKYKFCVVRDTYRQLWKTTIPSWWEWVPKKAGDWVGADGGPAAHTIRFGLPDGRKILLTAEFLAIGENKVEDVLRGYQVTAFYLNEADLLAEEVFTYCHGRTGRYPRQVDGGPSWEGVILDMNAPNTNNWTYKTFVKSRPDAFEFYPQPSGLSPRAENLANIDPDYYQKKSAGMPEWYVRRMIENQFGYSRDGKPVYPEFNDQLHVSPVELKPVKALPLIVGLDAGGTPAATLWQRMANGQWRGLDELVAPEDETTGPKRFGEHLNQLLREKYAGVEKIEGWADPSAAYGADKAADEHNWIQMVANKTKIRIRAAPGGNRITPRLEAVRGPLTRMIDGQVPGLLISPTMAELREGFASGYRFKKFQQGVDTRFDEKPEKNASSHVHDSAQYALLGGGDYAEIMGRENSQRDGRGLLIKTEENPSGRYLGEDPRRHPRGFDIRR